MRRKNFPLEIILSILFPEHANNYRISRGKIAEVNGLLFRHIHQRGERIDRIAEERSRPEILRQFPEFAELESISAHPTNLPNLQRQFGESLRLERTRVKLSIEELQPSIARRVVRRTRRRERRRIAALVPIAVDTMVLEEALG